jgi:hypothetical protein
LKLKTEYDTAWKATLETFLPACLEITHPQLAQLVDWSVEPEFLDTELQEIVRGSATGQQRVDKLIKLQRRDGASELLLIHVEVQSQRDDELPSRMFRYLCWILDRFGQQPVSLAILADPHPRWNPGPYTFALGGMSILYEYATCKLAQLDLTPWIAAGNPVARIIEAHRLAQGTTRNPNARRSGKLGLVRALLESGMGDVEIRELMRLVHWLLALPDEEEVGFRKDLRHMEASMQTKRRSNYERIVWEEGRDEGRLEGRTEGRTEGRLEGLDQGRHEGRLIAGRELLLEQIHERFGGCGESLRQRVESIQDETRIRQLARAILTVPTLSEFEARVSG